MSNHEFATLMHELQADGIETADIMEAVRALWARAADDPCRKVRVIHCEICGVGRCVVLDVVDGFLNATDCACP